MGSVTCTPTEPAVDSRAANAGCAGAQAKLGVKTLTEEAVLGFLIIFVIEFCPTYLLQ